MNGTGSNSDFNLDRLKAETGALRVISGSHKQPFHDRLDNIQNLKYSWLRKNSVAASESSFISPIPSYASESNLGDMVIEFIMQALENQKIDICVRLIL